MFLINLLIFKWLEIFSNIHSFIHSFIHSQALIVQDGPLATLFGVS
jgi:hypothetical protein